MSLWYLIAAFSVLPVQAVTVSRVCQASFEAFAARVQDCSSAASTILKNYPNGTILQQDPVSGCSHIYQSSTCIVDICAFPGQGINASTAAAVTDDIVQNCQSTTGSTTYTGGYNIIDGTNATIGVYGPSNPNQNAYKSTTSDNGSPSVGDCVKAITSITSDQNITQTDPSGCTIFGASGSCKLSFCDVPGAQMKGSEAYPLLAASIFAFNNNSRMSGFVQLSPRRRLGVFLDPLVAQPPKNSATIKCENFGDQSPLVKDCQSIFDHLSDKYPNTITQSQANDGCINLYSSSSCQLDLCGATGTKTNIFSVLAALSNVNSTCSRTQGANNTPVTGGYTTMYGTNLTLSLTSAQAPVNRWCNANPNNSPKIDDCVKLYSSIDNTLLYQQQYPFQGCSLLAVNGTCRLNYCAPPGDTINGRDLQDIVGGILYGCGTPSYTSGVHQIGPNTSVSLYDPPTPGDTYGDILCGNAGGSKISLSPLKTDCDTAIDYLLGGNQATCANTAPNSHQCTTVYTSGSCGIAMCGQNNYVWDCQTFAQAALQIDTQCVGYDSSGRGYTTGTLGVRLQGGYNVQVIVYNHNEQPSGPYTDKNGSKKRQDLAPRDPGTVAIVKRNPPGPAGPYLNPVFYLRQLGQTNLWLVVTGYSAATVQVSTQTIQTVIQKLSDNVETSGERVTGYTTNPNYANTPIGASISATMDMDIYDFISSGDMKLLEMAFTQVLADAGTAIGYAGQTILGYICETTQEPNSRTYWNSAMAGFQWSSGF